MSGHSPLGHWLAETGAIAGGGAVLGGLLGYATGAVVNDIGLVDAQPKEWAERGVQLGGFFGFVVAVTSTVRSRS